MERHSILVRKDANLYSCHPLGVVLAKQFCRHQKKASDDLSQILRALVCPDISSRHAINNYATNNNSIIITTSPLQKYFRRASVLASYSGFVFIVRTSALSTSILSLLFLLEICSALVR